MTDDTARPTQAESITKVRAALEHAKIRIASAEKGIEAGDAGDDTKGLTVMLDIAAAGSCAARAQEALRDAALDDASRIAIDAQVARARVDALSMVLAMHDLEHAKV